MEPGTHGPENIEEYLRRIHPGIEINLDPRSQSGVIFDSSADKSQTSTFPAGTNKSRHNANLSSFSGFYKGTYYENGTPRPHKRSHGNGK